MHDLVVVGAGLSGLALTRMMRARGADVAVLEARARIGGRVLSHRTQGGAYDLGPGWVWPTMQPRIAAAVRAAGLELYEQAEAGAFLHQDHAGRIRTLPHGFAQDPPSMRIKGGIGALVAAMATDLPPASLHLNHSVSHIALGSDGVDITANGPAGPVTLRAARVALALPPRLIAGITLTPSLPAAIVTRLTTTPGWMAGQAKALALYDRPAWRDSGLSGSAFSQAGPLGEIHDASLPDGGPEGAVFGFFLWPAGLRAARRTALPGLVADQLSTLFSIGAPREVIIQDWATDPCTAAPADRTNGGGHPDYRPIALPHPWAERIILAGAEAAPEFGGYLEGALAAAEAAVY